MYEKPPPQPCKAYFHSKQPTKMSVGIYPCCHSLEEINRKNELNHCPTHPKTKSFKFT